MDFSPPDIVLTDDIEDGWEISQRMFCVSPATCRPPTFGMRLSCKVFLFGLLLVFLTVAWWVGPPIPARMHGEWVFDEPAFTDGLAAVQPALHKVVLQNRATNGPPWSADIVVSSRGIRSTGPGGSWDFRCSRVANQPSRTIARARSFSGPVLMREVMLVLESSGDDLWITVEHTGQPGVIVPFHRQPPKTDSNRQ